MDSERFEEAFNEFRQEVRQEFRMIKEVLVGDYDRKGMVHDLTDIRFEIWDKDAGLKKKVQKLEETKTYAKGYFAGALFIASAVGGAAGFLLSLLAK